MFAFESDSGLDQYQLTAPFQPPHNSQPHDGNPPHRSRSQSIFKFGDAKFCTRLGGT